MDTPPTEFDNQLDDFLHLAGKRALTNPAREDFVQWFAVTVPQSLPGLLAQAPQDPQAQAQFLHVAAQSLYGELPFPAQGWVASGQRKQERNAPCACGSGRKYKHCCGAMTMPPLFGNLNLLRYVLDACPKRRLAELAESKAGIDAVADTAWQWEEEGDPERAVALVEPYFKRPGSLDARLSPLFNLLMDAWLALGRGTKRERLIDDVLQRGDKILRSDALQRRTTMLADRGEHAAAWQTFRQASALNPSDPALGFLEVSTLVSEGRLQEAQGRAQWWAAALARQRDPTLADLIERLREIARDPLGGMLGATLQTNAHWARLHVLFLEAPAPLVRHQFEVFAERDAQGVVHQVASALAPDAALAQLEARWHQVFAQHKPSMTAVQNDAPGVWDNADAWLDLLHAHPHLWFSFDVLDDLVMALDTIDVVGVQQRLLMPMAERAAAQLRLTLASLDKGPVECHWGVWPNRVALRPVAHLAFVCLENGHREQFMELAEWLVFDLNPQDNHGLRADLSSAYAQAARWTDVLALRGRFADDMDSTLALNAVLAAYMLGDHTAAPAHLTQAAKDHPELVRMLLSQAPKPVAPDKGGGILLGGRHEAWRYVSDMRPVWEQHQALDWARSVLAAKGHRRVVVPPAQEDM
ncbi:MAG: SEC-C domain-containing protein [Rhodoferax sp.]|nr:SEC-C domain-containing protein [Rhodoferax sp.]